MPYLKTSAQPVADLHYIDRGAGKPVVLIHGWPLSHRMWESQINALVEAGYRCIAYDRRGFGDSSKPQGGYDYDTFASDLNDVMTTLDLKGVALGGFSMGGGEVARYLGRYGSGRVAKAMLLGAVTPFLLKTPDNPGGADLSVFEGMIAGVKKDRIGFLENFMKAFFNWTPGSGSPSDDVVAFSKSVAWVASPVGTQECIRAFGTTDFRADLKTFALPTLIVHGDKDQIVPLEGSGKKSHELIKGSRLEVLKGAPHGFAATHAEALNALLLDFLKS